MGRLLSASGIRSDAQSLTVEAVSGYNRRFPLTEAAGFLLALQVGDEVLTHGHGFAARLVAPGHRGFEWVKWVTRLQVNETGAWWQTPVPLQ